MGKLAYLCEGQPPILPRPGRSARKGKRVGIEVKLTDAPGTTKSMHAARTDLRLDRLLVVHAGERSFPLQDGIEAVSVRDMVDALAG